MLGERFMSFVLPLTLILLSVRTLVLADFGKCCARGEVFSGDEDVPCVPSPARSMELYTLNSSWSTNVFTKGYPNCGDPEEVDTTPLDEMLPYDSLPSPACLEVLHENTSVRSMPLVVHCRSNRDRAEESASSSRLPNFSNVRRCCPKDTVYSKDTKTCLPLGNRTAEDDPFWSENQFLESLPRNVDLLDFLIISRGPPRCEYAIYDYVVRADDLVFRDHTLRVSVKLDSEKGSLIEDLSVSGYEACLELLSDPSPRELVLRACRGADFCDENPCVRKCCAEDEVNSSGCQKLSAPRAPIGFHEALKNATSETNSSILDYGLLVGNPCLYDMYPLHRNEGWTVTSKGHVYVPGYETYDHGMHCIEILDEKNNNYEEGIYALICFDKPEDLDEPSLLRFEVNSAMMLTSCVFMLVTLLVYICLPALQNLHGKTLMCHVASLLLAYSCLAIIGLASPRRNSTNDKKSPSAIACKFLGFLLLFSFLSAFSWLNIMCFDIWWTFGGLRGSQSRSREHRKRFLYYCLYAWGLALIISTLGVGADYTSVLPVYLRPDIGRERCWFQQGPELYSEVLFFTGPISIQLTSNVVFFILTSLHCSKVKAEIRRVVDERSDPRSRRFHADRTKFIMNVKLFVVMGISWILEIVSYFLHHYAKDLQWRAEFFYVSDAMNCLQGLLIFILFVLKSRVYVALRKRLGLDKDERKASNNTTTALDPYKVRKSISSSTLMSTFNVSVAPS